MSEEVKTVEEVKAETTTTKKSGGVFGWFKNIVSAVVGAAISFGVTFGVINAEQEKALNEKMNGINNKAEQVVTSLQNGDVNGAITTAKEIAEETKSAKEIVETAVADTKEKVEAKVEEVKTTAEKAKEDITKAIKEKETNKTETDKK